MYLGARQDESGDFLGVGRDEQLSVGPGRRLLGHDARLLAATTHLLQQHLPENPPGPREIRTPEPATAAEHSRIRQQWNFLY